MQLKVGDYIVCKSIPHDAPDGSLVMDKEGRKVMAEHLNRQK